MTRLTRASMALFIVSAAWGQSQPQDWPYQVRYLSNLQVGTGGDSVINITNSGAIGAGLAAGTNASTVGSICANVYVFSPDEQMISCCSCPVTPNGLVSLSARADLINNTLTPAVPTSVVVKILSSYTAAGAGGARTCNNSASNPLNAQGTAAGAVAELPSGLIAWATTVHRGPTAGGGLNTGAATITETQFTPATLSGPVVGAGTGAADALRNGELDRLRSLCQFIQANGSGFGICASCRLGGLGGGRLQ